MISYRRSTHSYITDTNFQSCVLRQETFSTMRSLGIYSFRNLSAGVKTPFHGLFFRYTAIVQLIIFFGMPYQWTHRIQLYRSYLHHQRAHRVAFLYRMCLCQRMFFKIVISEMVPRLWVVERMKIPLENIETSVLNPYIPCLRLYHAFTAWAPVGRFGF